MVDPVGSAQSYGNVTPMSQAELLAAAQMGGRMGFDPTGAQNMVYMGPEFARPMQPTGSRSEAAATRAALQAQASAFRPIETATGYFAFMSDKDRKRLGDITEQRFGFPSARNNQTYLQSTWNEMVGGAANAGKWSGQPISPWEWGAGAYRGEGAGGAGGGGGGGAGAYTGPVKTVTLTDPDTAMGLIDQSLQSALGRQANQQEKQKFMEALREYEMQNPTVTTPTMQGGQMVGSVRTGGSNPQEFARRFGQAQEGSAEFAASTTFLDAFMDALGNPVR
jgi:hypothetical protein